MRRNGDQRHQEDNGGRLADVDAETLNRLSDIFEPGEPPDLVYLLDDGPGIRRVRRGKAWSYHHPDGELISRGEERQRIERLAIPPAWDDVWISPHPYGHLQATGRDKRGRKQYIYHDRWRAVREADKFDRLLLFGRLLPLIRERARQDGRRRKLSRDKVLGIAVQMLDRTLIRVGNEEYVRENEAYGLTTLRDDHAEISTSRLRLVFPGKAGKEVEADVRSARLARAVRRCRELPGEELFQYVDEDDEPHPIDSGDVNDYLRQTAGEDVSAKDFRTWGGTVIAARVLAERGKTDNRRAADKSVNEALDEVAEHLGNTRAVARSSYVHPEVIASFYEAELTGYWPHLKAQGPDMEGLRREEKALLRLLEHRTLAGEHKPHG